MSIHFRPLRSDFFAEATSVDLREVRNESTLSEIRSALDRYGVIVFADQSFTDDEQLDFAERFDGDVMHRGSKGFNSKRLGNDAMIDISNLDEDGEIMQSDSRRRMYQLANRLWHTDASFIDPPGRYSMLHARVVPPVRADTQFADTRAAYEALSDEMKMRLEGLSAHHSIAYSRQTLGFEFSADEEESLKGAIHPLVRLVPGSNRPSLYLASHASRIIDWPVPEGRLLLLELMEHATRPMFTHTHAWTVGDLVIWDNRTTMHRGLPYDDVKYRRDLRRITSLDLPRIVADPSLAEATSRG